MHPMMYVVFYSMYRHSKHRALHMSAHVDERTKQRYRRRVEMITDLGIRLELDPVLLSTVRSSSVVPVGVVTTILTMITFVSSITTFCLGVRVRRHVYEAVDVKRVYIASLGRRVFDDIECICAARAKTWIDQEKEYDVAVIARDILLGCLFGARSKTFPLRDQGLVSWTPSSKRKRAPRRAPRRDPFVGLRFIDTEPIVCLRRSVVGGGARVSVVREPMCLPWEHKNLKTSIACDGDDLIRREFVEDTEEEDIVVKGLLFQGDAHDRSVGGPYGAICPPMHSLKVLRNSLRRCVYSTTKRGRAWGASESILDFLPDHPTEESLRVLTMLVRRVGWIHHDFIALCGAIPCDTGSKNMVMM